MSKPYQIADLSSQLDQDFTWRMREISDLRAAIKSADVIGSRVLLRSLVPICYAHWEGFVRFSANKYLNHIALRKHHFHELDSQFLKNYFMPRLAALQRSGTSLTERCDLMDSIFAAGGKRFSRVNDDLVNTKANLNFEVFLDICLVCGVSTEPFLDQKDFVDVFLLKRRNAIAHGEEMFIDLSDLDKLKNDTLALMRSFKDELDNNAVLKSYMAV